MKKKLIILLTALLVLLCAACISVSAGGSLTAGGVCGPNIGWFLYDGYELSIAGTGAMYDYDGDTAVAPWTDYADQITKITIEGGVTKIGAYSFSYMPNVTSVTIDPEVIEIGESAFSGLGMTSISLPEGLQTIGTYAFNSCKQLENITIPATVKTVGEAAFAWCDALESITIVNGVISLGDYAFAGAYNISTVNIPASVEFIGEGCFSNCSDLSAIYVDSFNVNHCDVGGVLYNRDKTILYFYPPKKTSTTFDIPNTVIDIKNSAFSDAYNLTKINIPDSVRYIGDYAFAYCGAAEEITGLNNVETIGQSAFSYCSSVVEITLPQSVTSIGASAFQGCSKLKFANVPEGITTLYQETYAGCTSLWEITLPRSLKTIEDGVFYACNSLETIFYNGTPTKFAAIDVGESNDALDTVEVVFASFTDANIVVSSAKGASEKEVKVTLSLENNPGIISMLLNVSYDKEYLILTNVEDAGVLGLTVHGNDLTKMPYTLSWANDTATKNITTNGTIVTLTFKIAKDAPVGKYPIEITYDNDLDQILNVDLQPVDFNVENGEIEVIEYIVGDVDGDGFVTSTDQIILSRRLANWTGYEEETIDKAAADVNNDGKVTSTDRIILSRHIAKWTGYDTLPFLG